jgi:8-oxo-dGTP diphosphatase
VTLRQIFVVGAVIVDGGKVLAVQRGEAMALPGLWEFPGGKIELNETPEGALVREIEEELQCTVSVGAHVETTAHEYEFGVVTLSTYFCTLLSGRPALTEHAQLSWLAPDDLHCVDWAPADIPAVAEVKRALASAR